MREMWRWARCMLVRTISGCVGLDQGRGVWKLMKKAQTTSSSGLVLFGIAWLDRSHASAPSVGSIFGSICSLSERIGTFSRGARTAQGFFPWLLGSKLTGKCWRAVSLFCYTSGLVPEPRADVGVRLPLHESPSSQSIMCT